VYSGGRGWFGESYRHYLAAKGYAASKSRELERRGILLRGWRRGLGLTPERFKYEGGEFYKPEQIFSRVPKSTYGAVTAVDIALGRRDLKDNAVGGRLRSRALRTLKKAGVEYEDEEELKTMKNVLHGRASTSRNALGSELGMQKMFDGEVDPEMHEDYLWLVLSDPPAPYAELAELRRERKGKYSAEPWNVLDEKAMNDEKVLAELRIAREKSLKRRETAMQRGEFDE
jgi:hypothetical protein